tara:strand:+ start:4099 stop:5043 length:945 start_codon:yes stop_codon:yes gene_type:complete
LIYTLTDEKRYARVIKDNTRGSYFSMGYVMDTVALVGCKDNFKEALEKAINLIGGLGDLCFPLILKPNMCSGKDVTGHANVEVGVIGALVDRILEDNPEASLRIVESNSVGKFANKAFTRFGYRTYVDELSDRGIDISLHNLSKEPLVPTDYDGYYLKRPEMPSLLMDAGGLISVALAKTHGLTFVTGALKNLFGLLPSKGKGIYHPEIHKVILDLNLIFRSRLSLIDGRVGLEGVVKGTPRELGCIILGRNPASVDATMARVMGFDPMRIRHIVEAVGHGLGSLDPVVVGSDVGSHVVEFREAKGLKANAVLG